MCFFVMTTCIYPLNRHQGAERLDVSIAVLMLMEVSQPACLDLAPDNNTHFSYNNKHTPTHTRVICEQITHEFLVPHNIQHFIQEES